jgi:hypothetical protein
LGGRVGLTRGTVGRAGGIWRIAYKIDSIGEPAALLYLLSQPLGILFLLLIFVAIVLAVAHKAGLVTF